MITLKPELLEYSPTGGRTLVAQTYRDGQPFNSIRKTVSITEVLDSDLAFVPDMFDEEGTLLK